MFVRHLIHLINNDAERGGQIVPSLYDYVMAENGVFIRAERKGLRAQFPISRGHVRGLEPLKTAIEIAYPRVPVLLTNTIISLATDELSEAETKESLFHLRYDARTSKWEMVMPEQAQTATSVRPLDDRPGSSYANAMIEIHSHGRLPAFFSEADDMDETGFRLYGVIGDLDCEECLPRIRLRVGVYGYYYEINPNRILELTENIRVEERFEIEAKLPKRN